MLIGEFGEQFRRDAAALGPAVPAGTPLGATAAQIREMILCYASDGELFFRNGDWVNAAASFAYGYGWLDAGVFLGYLSGRAPAVPAVPAAMPVLDSALLPGLAEHLTEKTGRYNRMLIAALGCVVPAPDRETVMYRAFLQVCAAAKQCLESGEDQLGRGDEVNALSSFSYGYGWLDCGVRAGLSGIDGDRHLFTI